MGALVIDAFAGKTAEELQADCRRLLRVASDRQAIIMEMIEDLGDRVDTLPPRSRDYARKLIEAYRD